MISGRLLSKLQIGKKYIITDGIGFYVLEPNENIIWCTDLQWPLHNGRFGIYKRTWQEILDENQDDRDFCHDIKYKYDTKHPTYQFTAHISKLFVSANTYFRTYGLYFLGEHKNDDISKLKKYCDLFRISYGYYSKKERLKNIYSNVLTIKQPINR